jgi:hypothetical protein
VEPDGSLMASSCDTRSGQIGDLGLTQDLDLDRGEAVLDDLLPIVRRDLDDRGGGRSDLRDFG